MTAARKIQVVTGVRPVAEARASGARSLIPTFKVEVRRRHDEEASVEHLMIPARTLASARHAARLARPDSVILSVTRA